MGLRVVRCACLHRFRMMFLRKPERDDLERRLRIHDFADKVLLKFSGLT